MNKEYRTSNTSSVVKEERPYIVVKAGRTEYLMDSVNSRIEMGYKPFGNPFVYSDQVCQAMVRE